MIVLIAQPALAASDPAIEQSIAKAKAWLYSQQKPDGSWESVPKPTTTGLTDPTGLQWGGQTALVTYALLASGERPDDPRIGKAIAFLKKAEIQSMYALSVRMQVWLALPESPEIRKLMAADGQAVNAAMHRSGPWAGFYDYKAPPTSYSLSRSQYGVLAMWAAAQAGLEVPASYWKQVEDAWLKAQSPQGAWKYSEAGGFAKSPQFPYTAGITAVGVATLYLTQEYLHADAGIACKGNIPKPEIDKGLAWLANHIEQLTPRTKLDMRYTGATLYAFERAGLASGLRYIGKTDWFAVGSKYVLSKQKPDGAWQVSGVKEALTDLVDTSFCLLFLARGRSPVIFGKLDFTDEADKTPADWNQRSRDIANLTRWFGRQVEREVRWEIMNLHAGAKDLNDVPVLFMAGSKPLKLSDAQKQTLKGYIENGGLLLGHADCANPAFANSFKAIARDLFPDYEFRELPDSHPIYTRQMFLRNKWKNKPSVQGLSNGVRELMLLIPTADVGRTWQRRYDGGKQEQWQLGADIALYAVDRQLLPPPAEEAPEPALVRGRPPRPGKTIKLARLQYPGNWDPEPAGWRRLATQLRRTGKADMQVSTVKLGEGSLAGVQIAHLTGTTAQKFDEKAVEQLKRFIANGGTLLIDAAGGSGEFATSAEQLAATLGTLKSLPPEHPWYTDLKVTWREFARASLGSLPPHPRLQVIEHDGRPAVIYSREDLSAGLVGQRVDGIIGYTPPTALELTTRIVLATAK